MLSSLDHVPHDILQHIALVGASPGSAPPMDLCCLLATCRTLYDGLNIYSSPHLYAAIFKLKYDAPTIRQHTDSSLASELVQRCRALRRCLRFDMSLPGLRQDLWTLLWMAVEEGHCASLSDACFSKFIIELAQFYLREDVQPRGEIKSLVIWLLCLGLSRQDILSQNPEIRSVLVALLRPFVSNSASRVPPFTSLPPYSIPPLTTVLPLAPLHVEDPGNEVVMRYNVPMCSPHLPSPSDAAIILIFALKEAMPLQVPYHVPATRAIAAAENRVGPTAEDYAAFQRALTVLFFDIRTTAITQSSAILNFLDIDPWISEMFTLPHSLANHARPVYIPGLLTGVWEGAMMVSRVSLGALDAQTPLPPDFLCRTPMQCEFSEYHCFSPARSDGLAPIDDKLNLEFGLKCPAGNSSYQKFNPGEDFQHGLARPISDHILLGQTRPDHEDAWGSSGYDFVGRVHNDGLIMFTRRPKNEDSETSETWIFEGRLRYGTAFVGTFRSSSDGSCGVHGIFSMSKRATAPMQ